MSKDFNALCRTNSTFWLLFFCMSLAILVGACIQFDTTILVLMAALVIFTLLLLLKESLKYLNVHDRDWGRLSAELMVPTVLWLLFGLGGLLSFFMPEVVTKFGTTYEAAAVFLMAIYVSIGAVCYVWAFRWGSGNTSLRAHGSNVVSPRMLTSLLVALLVFDWYVRLDQIRGGIYFTWTTLYAGTTQALLRTTNALYQFHNTVAPIILPLLVYAVVVYSKKWSYVAILLAQSALIVLQGQRRDVLLIAFAVLLPFLAMKKLHMSRKLLLGAVLAAFLFLGFVGPVMEEARLMMRNDARSLLARPEQIIGRYVFEYVPQAISLDRIFGGSEASLRAQKNISLTERVGAYMSYAASIHQAMIDGRAGPNLKQFGTALSLVIPRFLYPGKPVVDANDMVYEHFGFGQLGRDATGSTVADIFGYLHLPGIMGLFIVVGIGYGFVARHLRRNYGQIGDMIMIGILPSALPLGDAFGGYLASLRNVLVLIALITLFVRFYPLVFGRRYRSRAGQSKNRSTLRPVLTREGHQVQ